MRTVEQFFAEHHQPEVQAKIIALLDLWYKQDSSLHTKFDGALRNQSANLITDLRNNHGFSREDIEFITDNEDDFRIFLARSLAISSHLQETS